jgi:signal transduction histidine kinase
MTRTMIGVQPLGIRPAPAWTDPVLAALTAVLAVTVLVTADLSAIDPALHPASPLTVLATAVGAAGIGLRRRMPLLGLALVAGAAMVVAGTWHFTGLLPYLTMLAVYSAAAYGTRREAILGLVVVVGCFIALQGAGVPDLAVIDVATSAAICVAAAAVGDAVRQRRAHHRDMLAAAEGRAEIASQQAVVQERLRIARELHDVVAHSMSLIAVQAGVGAHLLHRDPEAAQRPWRSSPTPVGTRCRRPVRWSACSAATTTPSRRCPAWSPWRRWWTAFARPE